MLLLTCTVTFGAKSLDPKSPRKKLSSSLLFGCRLLSSTLVTVTRLSGFLGQVMVMMTNPLLIFFADELPGSMVAEDFLGN